ncbi:MAG: hypothetical protein V3U92_14145 [Cellulophaga sp.]
MGLSKKIVSFFVALLVLTTIMLPSVIRIDHALFEHETLECDLKGDTHFHVPEVDCDFHDYQLSSVYFFQKFKGEAPAFLIDNKIGDNKYVSGHTLHISYFPLRGPPQYS